MDENLEQTVLERLGRRRAMKAPLFGRRAEKEFRERHADDFNYGGRTESPDPDMADARPADKLHTDEPLASPLFSSPLPDHAFPTGDLNENEAAPTDRRHASPPVRAMRPAGGVRRFGGVIRKFFIRH